MNHFRSYDAFGNEIWYLSIESLAMSKEITDPTAHVPSNTSEFFPETRWPQTLLKTTTFKKWVCWLTGGHRWRKFLWGGIESPFDCDCCEKCLKFRGPLDINRLTPYFNCKIE